MPNTSNVIKPKNRLRILVLNHSDKEHSKVKNELSEYLGVSWRTIHRWYTNPDMDIPLSASIEIAKFFNVPVEEVAVNTEGDEKAI